MSSQPAISPDVLARHGEFVRSLARSLLTDEHAADDVAQEAWVRFAKRPPRSALDPRGWFTIVVRNLARNERRAQRTRDEHEARAARPEASASLDEELAQASALRSVVDAVLALDEPYRATVLARYFRGIEPSRIASETGVPLATIKSRLLRAHAQLRERLDREHGTRAHWAVALGQLAGLERAAPAATGTTAGLAKATGIAAVLAVAALVASRAINTSRTPEEQLARDASLGTDAAGESESSTHADNERAPAVANSASGRETLVVAGTVRDLAYAALGLADATSAGVEVEARFTNGLMFHEELLATARAITRADGTFMLTLPFEARPDLWLVVVTPSTAERRRAHAMLQIDASGGAVEKLELIRVARGLATGRVVDSDGTPMPGARARLRWGGDVPEVVEVVAGEGGEFVTPHVGKLAGVDALDVGALVVHFDEPRELDEGGASGPRVVLARAAELVVRVLDAEERGIGGATIELALDDSEKRRVGTDAAARSWRADSADDGRAAIEGLPSGVKLTLSIKLDSDTQRSSSAHDGELVFAPQVGAPLVLVPGERRGLSVHWRGALALVGTTSAPDGTRIASAIVEISQDVPRTGDYLPPLARLKSDARGEFSVHLRAHELSAPLAIVAADKRSVSAELAALGYASSGATQRALGRITLNPNAAVGGALRAELVLEPTLSIAARILDADGQAVTRSGLGSVRLWAVPAGSSSHRAGASGLGAPSSKLETDGSCVFSGLSPGNWDLYVSREIESFYTWESFVHAFPAVPAGAQGVELRLTRVGEVRIRVRTHGGEPDEMTVLHGALFPRDSGRTKELAPREMRVSGVTGWPVRATLGLNGIGGDVDERGTWAHGFYGTKEISEHALQPMGPGWYVIGVVPERRDGSRSWFTQASELRWFEPGDYVIDFELVATTELSGRVLGDARAEHLAVELRSLDGARVPLQNLPGFGKPAHVLETDAQGGFVLRNAPVGAFLLRAGARDELERGEFRRELRVELAAGGNAPLEITLP